MGSYFMSNNITTPASLVLLIHVLSWVRIIIVSSTASFSQSHASFKSMQTIFPTMHWELKMPPYPNSLVGLGGEHRAFPVAASFPGLWNTLLTLSSLPPVFRKRFKTLISSVVPSKIYSAPVSAPWSCHVGRCRLVILHTYLDKLLLTFLPTNLRSMGFYIGCSVQ